MKPVGWRYDSWRHSLASRGVRTKNYFSTKKQFSYYAHPFSDPGLSTMKSEFIRQWWEENLAGSGIHDATGWWGLDPQFGEDYSEELKKYFNSHPELAEKISEIANARWEAMTEDQKNEWREVAKKGREEYWRLPKSRLDAADRMKTRWSDEEYREKMNAFATSDEERSRRSEVMKKVREEFGNVWDDPEIRERMISGITKNWQDESFRQRMLDRRRAVVTPEFRKKLSDSWTDERKNELSERSKLMWKDDEMRDRMLVGSSRGGEFAKALWGDQEYRKSQIERLKAGWTEDVRKRFGERASERLSSQSGLNTKSLLAESRESEPDSYEATLSKIRYAQGARDGGASGGAQSKLLKMHTLAKDISAVDEEMKPVRDSLPVVDTFMSRKQQSSVTTLK